MELPVHVADHVVWARVIDRGRCADSALHPDEWFPVSQQADVARREAASAITICSACPVQPECLELSLRHWDVGQHGVWGGLVAADRSALRNRARRHSRTPARSGPAARVHRLAAAQATDADTRFTFGSLPCCSLLLDRTQRTKRPDAPDRQSTRPCIGTWRSAHSTRQWRDRHPDVARRARRCCTGADTTDALYPTSVKEQADR